MKTRFVPGLVVGIVLTLLVLAAGAYLYFAQGFAPVATSAAPMPFEKTLAKIGLHAAISKTKLKTPPIEASETNLLAGAMIYQDQCSVCHGLPGGSKTSIAQGMFPPPPQLFHGKGVTDDPPGETYWKVANGIRLTGMPGFEKTLKDDQLWQVTLLLVHADSLPASVTNALAPDPSGGR